MSQEQPRRPSGHEEAASGEQGQAGAVRYGDVFPAVRGGLAETAVAPQDAATMQSAENLVFGHTLRGGPAAAMQSAASANERAGAVGHAQATDATALQGVAVSETRVPVPGPGGGGRLVTEFVAGQAVGQYLKPDDDGGGAGGAGGAGGVDKEEEDVRTKVTIGEALEATALAAGDMPVEHSDAAAIQAADARATGLDGNIVPGGLAATAQAAAAANAAAARDGDMIKFRHVLADATTRLVADKPVEVADAVGVASAENRNREDGTARPGGVAASMAAAARLNRGEAVWE